MGDDPVRSIAEAVERTAAGGTARVVLETVSDTRSFLDMPQPEPVRRRGVSAAAGRLFDKGFQFSMKLVMRHADCPRRADGFMDAGARRCAIDWGAYAQTIEGSSGWSGRSGRSLATLPEEPAPPLSPLWLFDLLRGVTEASEVGSERVAGRRCLRLSAISDMARVSEAIPGKTALPPGLAYEELSAVPVDVWLDEDGYVRRIDFDSRLVGKASSFYSLELSDFGTEARSDPSRLPLLKDARTGVPV